MQERDARAPFADCDDRVGFNPFGSGPVPIRPRPDRGDPAAGPADEAAKER